MEKSGLYNRQSILSRTNTRTVDKNNTFNKVEHTENKFKSAQKIHKLGTYHNYLRVNHFGTREEVKQQQGKLRQEADLQLRIKAQVKADERRTNQMEDRSMMTHLKREIEKDAGVQKTKRENLMKISQENKQTAMFKSNISKRSHEADNITNKRAIENHEIGYKTSFY